MKDGVKYLEKSIDETVELDDAHGVRTARYSIEEWRARVQPQFRDPTLAEIWDEDWRATFATLRLTGDEAILSEMFGRAGEPNALPVPAWVFHELSARTNPETNPREADRLVYQRSDALKRKVKTNEDKIAVGIAVIDLVAGGEMHKNAVSDIVKRTGLSKSYGKMRSARKDLT